MKKTEKNLLLCGMLFVVSLVIANVVTAKTIQTGIPLFGSTITLPGAALCYAITFLMTDVVGEIWGKKEAQTIVKWGFVGQILATALIVFTQYLPPVSQEMQLSYEMLLGQNWVFVIASLSGYLIAQSWDVWVFHKIREKFNAKHNMRWVCAYDGPFGTVNRTPLNAFSQIVGTLLRYKLVQKGAAAPFLL